MARTRGWYWPWLVTAALLFTVGANVVMYFAATSDRNASVVESDYYRKAVAWDQTMAVRAASDQLGWQASATLRRTAGENDSAALEVRTTDRGGAPVVGARYTATLIHNADAANPTHASLNETAPGRYVALVPIAHRGRWEIRLDARRESARFVAILHADVEESVP